MIEINYWSIIAVVALVFAGIGIGRMVYMISKISIKEAYTNRYLNQFNNWLKTKRGDSAEELFTWLTQNTGQIQSELGQSGVAANYISPGSSYALTNYQVIVNTLPLIKIGVATELEVNACKDALNRHIGKLKYARMGYLLALLNPFKWILEGVKLIITFPIYLFYWVGLYKYKKIISVEGSKGFKIVNALVALIGFIGLIMGMVVDWDNFWTIIKQLKK